jgi:uncharacterized protein YlxW (UPF0749 family)
MKNNEATVFVFTASIIIGILISLNINLSKKSDRVILNAKQYQDAYNLKIKLKSDISNLSEKMDYYNDKILKYKNSDKSKSEILKGISEEIDTNLIAKGTSDVHGQGIKITLDDAEQDFTSDRSDKTLNIVHDIDVMFVINDLRAAGAEAISINNQRVVDSTEVYCDGRFLSINHVKVAAPFMLYAIGNIENLKNYMNDYENYLSILRSPGRGVMVNLEEQEDIIIKGYDGEIKSSHLTNKK